MLPFYLWWTLCFGPDSYHNDYDQFGIEPTKPPDRRTRRLNATLDWNMSRVSRRTREVFNEDHPDWLNHCRRLGL